MASVSASRPIVVGYDASPPSEAALQWAARAADQQKRTLVILHAAERISYTQDAGSGLWKAEDVIADAKETAGEGRNKVLEEFPDLEVDVAGSLFSAKVALGERSTTASMMVLGSHGRGRVGTLLLGSTAYSIAGYSRCPVVIIRDGGTTLPGADNPVVVGINGTGGSERAVDTAAEVAREWGAPLLLATVWSRPSGNRKPAGYSSIEEAAADHRSAAEVANAEMLGRVATAHADLTVDGTVIEGHPVDALVEAGSKGGLLVVGTHGQGSLAGAVLGSTTLGVLSHSTAPIMVAD
ncbi:MAG: universal stress protein [Ornithinimicrobium sp.]